MKIHIGPYVDWFGPYQLADLLKYVGVSEDRCHEIGKWIPEGPFQWFHDKLKRKVKIKIDPYDSWSADHTLAMVITPVLKQLRETVHGWPQSDIFPTMESWEAALDEMIWAFDQCANHDWEGQFHSSEVIHIIEKKEEDNVDSPFILKSPTKKDLNAFFDNPHIDYKFDNEGYTAHVNRMRNGFRLFGENYFALWD